jgi:hypothetical protein
MNSTLDYKEIELLIEELTQKIREEIIFANRTGNLEKILEKYDYNTTEHRCWYYYPYASKIIVIGDILAKQKDVEKCLKELGINKNQVDLYSDYEKITNTNFSFLKNNFGYSDILVCAMPHKINGIGNNESFISMVENNIEEYPPLIKIVDESGNLKYSNSAFKKALYKTNLYKEINCLY